MKCFEELEAKISINNSANTNDNLKELGGLFGENLYESRQIKVENINLEKLDKKTIKPYINYNSETKKLTILKIPIKSKREIFIKNIQVILSNDDEKAEIEKIIKNIEDLKDDKFQDIELTKLLIKNNAEIVEFEETIINENINISENDIIKNANLTIDEFEITVNEHIGIIDINQNNRLSIQSLKDKKSLFKNEDEDEKNMIIHDIDELLEHWSKYATTHEKKSLLQFKNSMALGQTHVSKKKEGLTLSTVHTMKGQEYDIVFIIGMDEGTFPDYRATQQGGIELEQERNNLYVAFTRAKRLLYVTYPTQRTMPWGAVNYRKISSLLKNLD